MSRLPPLLTDVQWLAQVDRLPVPRPRHYGQTPAPPPRHGLTTCARCCQHVLEVVDLYGHRITLDARELTIVTWATLRARDLLAPELLTRSITGWDGTCLISGVVVTYPDTRTATGAPAPPPPPRSHPLTYLRPQQVPFLLATTTIRPLHVLTCPERT